eukprot:scpid98724/ scgid33040/ Hydroxyacid oxidase 1; Glycolate oxidase
MEKQTEHEHSGRRSYLPFVRIEQFEAKAKSVLPRSAYAFQSTGATAEITLRENCLSFSRLLLKWRCLRGVADVDLSTTVQGDRIASPICVAPSGLQGLAHPDGELAMARACTRSNTIMTASTVATFSLEDIASAAATCAARSSPQWFQLYCLTDRELTRQLVLRAEKVGYRALVMTIDLPPIGIRYVGERAFTFPPWNELANFSGAASQSASQSRRVTFDASMAWHDIDWLKSITK